MKCQKCGRNEVNFHYSSNVNGNVTEQHLCSSCAEEAGYDMRRMFDQTVDFGGLFGGMLPMSSGVSGFMPLALPAIETDTITPFMAADSRFPFIQANVMFPFTLQHRPGIMEQDNSCNCGCGQNKTKGKDVEVDKEMSMRRELNKQMRIAVENEEFEKAAELRDKIKELESK